MLYPLKFLANEQGDIWRLFIFTGNVLCLSVLLPSHLNHNGTILGKFIVILWGGTGGEVNVPAINLTALFDCENLLLLYNCPTLLRVLSHNNLVNSYNLKDAPLSSATLAHICRPMVKRGGGRHL